MSEYQEYEFLLSILTDLKHNYPEHHDGALQQIIQILQYRIERFK